MQYRYPYYVHNLLTFHLIFILRLNIFAVDISLFRYGLYNPIIKGNKYSQMKPSTLKEELIRDFQDQKRAVNEQLALIDPMAASLRKPAAQRLINTSFIVFMEIICWVLFLGCIAFVLFMDRLFPFYYLSKLIHDTSLTDRYNTSDIQILTWIIRGMALVAAILFLIITQILTAVRRKNSVLHFTGKNLKLLAEQLLQRKAAMEALEQRNPIEMPSNPDTVVIPNQNPHNDILL